MKRCFTNILSDDVEKTAQFYESLLGMKRDFNSDWFVTLVHDEAKGFELGILKKTHDTVPANIRKKPAGIILTFVVSDCETVFERATQQGMHIIEPPTDMPYGQRRVLLRDPDGTVVDISSLMSGYNI